MSRDTELSSSDTILDDIRRVLTAKQNQLKADMERVEKLLLTMDNGSYAPRKARHFTTAQRRATSERMKALWQARKEPQDQAQLQMQ